MAQFTLRRLRSLLCLLIICALGCGRCVNAAEDPLRYMEKHASDYNTELIDLVNIPSISSLPEHQEDILSAATWLNMRLSQAGLNVRFLLLYNGQHSTCWEHTAWKMCYADLCTHARNHAARQDAKHVAPDL